MIKRYLYVGGAAALVLAFIGASYFSYKAGVSAESARQMAAIQKAQAGEREDVKEVIKYRDEIKVVYRDRIKYIKMAQDPTGCADTLLVDMGFGLHSVSEDSAKSGTDGAD